MEDKHSNVEYNCAMPLSRFIFRENGEFVEKTTRDLFYDKRILLFGLAGAFTPTSQVLDYESAYDDLIAAGVDEVYCISMNDAFVMNAWRESLGVQKVKFIPDGNGFFTRQLGKHVFKTNLGFGVRSWRYSAIIDSDMIEVMFNEVGQSDNCKDDPYENSKPEVILKYLKEVPRKVELDSEEDEQVFAELNKIERDLFLRKFY